MLTTVSATTDTTTTETTTSTVGCFSGEDQIHLIEGGRRSINSLEVGDHIWSLSIDDLVKFYTLKTIDENEISVTNRHYLPIHARETNVFHHIVASKMKIRD